MLSRSLSALKTGWGKALIAVGLVGCLALGASAHGAASSSGLVKVRFGGDQTQTRVVVELSRSAQAKLVSEGSPVVLDLPRIDLGAERQGAGQGLVKAWKADAAAGAARIKFELAKPAKIERRFLLAPADGVSVYRYVIDFKAEGAPALASAAPSTSARPILAAAAVPPLVKTRPTPLNLRKVVVIDAGHGGHDPGALGANAQEKTVTLAAARALRDRLERTGRYKVVMTRDSDTFVELENRVKIARAANADLFIALHADAGANKATRGASIYTLSDEGSQRVQRNVTNNGGFLNVSLPGRDRAVNQILLDLTQRATRNRSASFAELMIERVSNHVSLLPGSHRERGFFVLLAPDVPAVLFEMGFITNLEDERLLTDPAHRVRLADSVGDAIDAYFNRETRLASR